MRNFFILTCFLFKCGLGSAEGKGKKKSGLSLKIGKAATYILVGICMIPMMAVLFGVGKSGYEMFASIGLEGLVLQLACIIGGLVIFFFAITMVISVFYMTSDLEALLPLPLASWQIVGAKMTMALVYEYLWVLFFIAPVLVGYGVAAGSGIAYWISVVLGCLALPVVPLCYAGLITMVVMRVFKKIRNKDLLSTLGLGVSILFAFGISAFSQLMGTTAGSGDLVQILTEKAGLIKTMGNVFPNFRFLSNGLEDGSILQILLFILTSLVFAAVFLFVAQKIYLQTAVGMSEASDKKRRLTRAERVKASRERKPVYTYTMIEIKKMVRTPTYFFNCVLMCLIWPLFIMIPLIFSLMGSGLALGTIFRSSGFVQEISAVLKDEISFGIAMVVVAGISAFVGSMNMTTATAISREGTDYYIMKYLPMSYTDQLRAKVASGFIFSFIGSVIYIVLIEAVLIFLGMNILILPLSVIMNVAMLLLLNYVQLLLDLAYPKLVWENEAAAVKNNFHAAVGMFIGLGIGTILVVVAILLYNLTGISSYILVPVFMLLLIGVTWLIRKGTYAYGERRLESLED